MTSKQKWFLNKLMKEIETFGYEFTGNETNYGNNGYDFYKTTSKDASKDIDKLLKVKNYVAQGKEVNEAFSIVIEEEIESIKRNYIN